MIDIDPSSIEPKQSVEKPMNLSDFAQRNQITEDRVWELIEEGELAARFVNDEILILREHENLDEEPQFEGEISLPQVEVKERPIELDPIQDSPIEADLPLDDRHAMPPDDYRDLLMFAQDAMNRTMDLSRQLLATKDEMLSMKDARIKTMEAELQMREQEIRRLKSKLEDLETLCRLTPSL